MSQTSEASERFPPLSVLYLADLEGRRSEQAFEDWRPRLVDRESLDDLVATVRPRAGETVFEAMADLASGDAPPGVEAAWRGLLRLTGERTGTARIEAMGIALEDLREEVDEAPEPSKTCLHQQLHTRQWHSDADGNGRILWPKGRPFAAVLVAHPLGADDATMVAQLAEVTSRCQTVLVVDGSALDADALAALPGAVVAAPPNDRPELAVAEVGAAFLRESLSSLVTAAGEPLDVVAFRHRLAHALARIELAGRKEPFETRVAAMHDWLATPESCLAGAALEITEGERAWDRPRFVLTGIGTALSWPAPIRVEGLLPREM